MINITLIRIIFILFFSYVSVDAFLRARKVRLDAADEQINANLAILLRRRAMRTGFIFALLSASTVVSMFFFIPPLGD